MTQGGKTYVKTVKTALVGVVAVASLALAAGCNNQGDAGSSSSPSPSPSPSKTLTATEQFTSAASLLRGTPYKFSLKSSNGINYDGSDDPLAGIVVGKIAITVQGVKATLDTQLSQNDYYVKVSGLPVPGVDTSKWFHVDPTKVTSLGAIMIGGLTDPTGLQDLVKAVGTVESAGDKQLKGTFDFSKGTWGAAVDEKAVQELADKAKAVPFTASLDDKGRLSTLKVTIPAHGSDKEEVVDISYSDFGTAVKLTPPAAGETVEAPAAVYTLLNNA
jgi:hypothetical protein